MTTRFQPEPRPDVGRNDPCPCGSRKKYKKCCLGEAPRRQTTGTASEVITGLQAELGGKRLESLDDANEVIREIMARRNSAPIEEFSGLSADQMFRFLHFPFDSPNLVLFSERFIAPKDSPVMLLFTSLSEAIGTEGLRTTAKGNLPRDFCRETHQRFGAICPPDSASSSDYFKLTSEEDFLELHLVRLVAGLAGLLRKQRGRFLLTARGKEAAEDASGCLAYSALFRAAARKLNWGYFDAYPEYSIVQTGFLYSLFTLSRHGDVFRPEEFYGDLFVRAFPAVLQEARSSHYFTPREDVMRCHALRTFPRFALLFGLAEAKSERLSDRRSPLEVRKTLALDDFTCFQV